MLNVYIQDPQQKAQACIIWMHGLGADANDMKGVVKQFLRTLPIRHVFIDAPVRPVTLNNNLPMRAWYDILGMQLTDRQDRQGLMQSEALIHQVIEDQIANGFQYNQIYLAGFSQGAAMALFTGLRLPSALGGIIALSGYLPLVAECEQGANQQTPIFMALGRFDPIVLPAWTKSSLEWLQHNQYQSIAWHEYAMEHSICAQEIQDLVQWLISQISKPTNNGV